MLTFLELAHATHAMVLRAHALHATPMLTFLELAHATHAMVLRAHALHATHATPASSDKFIPPELSNKSGKGGAVNEKNLHLPLCLGVELPLAHQGKLQKGTCQNLLTKFGARRVRKKESQKSTCENTIAVRSTNHKISLKGHGLLPTCDLVVVVVVVVVVTLK